MTVTAPATGRVGEIKGKLATHQSERSRPTRGLAMVAMLRTLRHLTCLVLSLTLSSSRITSKGYLEGYHASSSETRPFAGRYLRCCRAGELAGRGIGATHGQRGSHWHRGSADDGFGDFWRRDATG